MTAVWRPVLLGLVVSFVTLAPAEAQVRVEYVAHACFVVQSPAGVRVVIDPYNGHRWLGYGFPDGLPADAVLISHPHYDHDASYYWHNDVPVLRLPGSYTIGDIRIQGVKGKHAQPYGKEFGQTNTVWLLEVGGLRIAHLGDNGPLSESAMQALERVDLLMMPVDGQFHILSKAQIADTRARLKPRVVIPMHYQIPALSDLPRSLGPIDPWLNTQPNNVVQLRENATEFAPQSLPVEGQVVVFPPSPAVEPWSEGFQQAMNEMHAADELLEQESAEARENAIVHLRRATELAPEAVQPWWRLGKALRLVGRDEEAIRMLELGLSGAGGDDWEFTMRARALLAELYEEAGECGLAARQYALIAASARQGELREQAEAFSLSDCSRQ